jgi:hypothetical protein
MAQLACRVLIRFDGMQWVVTVTFKHYAPIEMRTWTWGAAMQVADSYARTGQGSVTCSCRGRVDVWLTVRLHIH